MALGRCLEGLSGLEYTLNKFQKYCEKKNDVVHNNMINSISSIRGLSMQLLKYLCINIIAIC